VSLAVCCQAAFMIREQSAETQAEKVVVSPDLVYCLRRQEPGNSTQSFGALTMSKGMDSKKQTRKEPAKTMKEKRAAKKAKKAAKGSMR